MKGYIYISGSGTDPALHHNLNDPLFGTPPTLGACMPNIRRLVLPGDYIFVVSGKTKGVQQYVVGGFEVSEKISALAAHRRFPQNRLQIDEDGILQGNVITDPNGRQHLLDRHDPNTFEERVRNYVVGLNPVALESPGEVEAGRQQTLERLSAILRRPRGNRAIDVMARWAKLDERQVQETLEWLRGIKNPH